MIFIKLIKIPWYFQVFQVCSHFSSFSKSSGNPGTGSPPLPWTCPPPRLQPLLVTSGDQHWTPVQICSFEDPFSVLASGGHQSTYSWQVGGTHPTGMHFCFHDKLELNSSSTLFENFWYRTHILFCYFEIFVSSSAVLHHINYYSRMFRKYLMSKQEYKLSDFTERRVPCVR